MLGPQFSPDSRLFAESFKQFRGLTLDQALQGFEYDYSQRRPVHPDEVDEVRKRFRPGGPSTSERAAEIASQHRPIEHIVKDWMMNHKEMMVGTGTVHIARDLIDLGNEIRGSAKTPETKIYRGAAISPQEQVSRTPDIPISFTEDSNVAFSFAKAGNSRGKVFHAQAGAAKGLFVPDYVTRERTVGQNRRPEREWLIDPDSLK